MNKIVLALTFLAAGAGAFHSARHHASQLQQQMQAANESWQTHTQQLAAALSEQAVLSERVRELKQTLAQSKPISENPLWSALQTNRADRLPAELRERLFEELGFNWQSSADFIVVSKQAVRDIRMMTIRRCKLTECAATVLAITSEERAQVEAAIERIQVDFKDWAISHTERSEPRDDVLAQYTLQGFPVASITNNFTEAFSAIGKERTELMMIGRWQGHYNTGSISDWMRDIGMSDKPVTMILKRFSEGNKQLVKARVFTPDGTKPGQAAASTWDEISNRYFPSAFRPRFPNGWADVAEREGFEIPTEPQKQ